MAKIDFKKELKGFYGTKAKNFEIVDLPEMFDQACAQVQKNKNPIALSKLRLKRYHEGLSVQILHMGSYDDEAPTIARLHNEFIPDNNLTEAGKHHEIYLSDPRRVAPEKLKTILRQPVNKL